MKKKREKERPFLKNLFSTLWPQWNQGVVVKHSVQRGQRYLGYLFTAWTRRPEFPCRNERGETDESSKERMTALIPSCLLRHPLGGKFNKVHIPRATKEREENTWKQRWRDGEVAVMTDPSPTVSSLTFRIAREHWTPGGRMKHREAARIPTNTHRKNTDYTDTKIELLHWLNYKDTYTPLTQAHSPSHKSAYILFFFFLFGINSCRNWSADYIAISKTG